MHGLESWETRVVCLIQGQKCVDLAYSIRLELELLRHRQFGTEWRTWFLGIMAMRWHLPTEGEKTKEASSLQGRRRVGQWTRLAFRSCPLLSWGHSPQWWNTARLTAELPTPTKAPSTAMPQQEEPSLKFWSQHPLVIPLTVPSDARKREARPCKVSMPSDHRGDVSVQQPSFPLMEGD